VENYKTEKKSVSRNDSLEFIFAQACDQFCKNFMQ